MKNYYIKVGMIVTFLLVFNSCSAENELPSSQSKSDQDLLLEERNKYEKYDGPTVMMPQGDYSSITFSIQSNKKTYAMGEPIFIFTYAETESPEYIFIGRSNDDGILSVFACNQIKIFDENKKEVPLTLYGKTCFQKGMTYDQPPQFSRGRGLRNTSGRILLQPYRFVINNFFDMTTPGKYQITFYRKNFFNHQEYAEPLVSNTLTIEITDRSFTPEELVTPAFVSDLPEI